MINRYSSEEEIDSFLFNLFDIWIKDNNIFYENPNILQSLYSLLIIQKGNYIGYPNMIYIKILYRIVSLDLLSIREDEYLQDFRKFLISFFMYLEENAITGIICVKNNRIIKRLKYLKNELDLSNLDINTISNTHIVIILG